MFLLKKLILPGFKRGFDIRNSLLSADELDNLFTSLGTASGTTAQTTILISGNPGSSTCDVTIATNKGFTVTT
jgi:hypothetical protein